MPRQPMSRKRRQRTNPYENWVNEPLQNEIRDALARRDWTISDLGRKIGSQPSLVSRWMMGLRPSTESIALIADALGMDVLHLLRLSGHIPSGILESRNEQADTLYAMLKQVDWNDERYRFLFLLIEDMRNTPLTDQQNPPHNPTNPHPPAVNVA